MCRCLVRLSLANFSVLQRHQGGRLGLPCDRRATTRRRSSFTLKNMILRARWRCSGCACRSSPAAPRATRSTPTMAIRTRSGRGHIPGTYDAQQALVLSFSETSGLPMDSTAYKNNPSASTAVAHARLADRGRRQILRQAEHHGAGDGLAAPAAEPGAHGFRMVAHGRTAGSRGARPGRRCEGHRTRRLRFQAGGACLPGRGSGHGVREHGAVHEPVASRGSGGGRRPAQPVSRRRRGGQRADRSPRNRRHLHGRRRQWRASS
jgi:hypothetical protein